MNADADLAGFSGVCQHDRYHAHVVDRCSRKSQAIVAEADARPNAHG